MSILITFVFALTVLTFSGCGKSHPDNAAGKSIIGREISDFTEIDSHMVVGSFATVPRYTDSKYAISILGRKNGDSLKYVFFTKTNTERHPVRVLILDTLLIVSGRNAKEQLNIGGCALRGITTNMLVLAVYDRYAPSGQNIALAAWRADTLERKFVPIDPTELDCESEADMTDEP